MPSGRDAWSIGHSLWIGYRGSNCGRPLPFLRASFTALLVYCGLPAPANAQSDSAGEVAAEDSALPAIDPKPSESGGLLGSGFRLAPISWGGSLSADWSRSTTQGVSTLSQSQSLGLNASTYVLHPAILSVSGGLSLTTTRSTSPANENRVEGTTGSLSASGLSRTRFPLTVSYSVSDTALENLLSRTDYRAKNLSYTQNYRPEDSSYSTVANLTRAEVTAATGEESTSNTMSLGGNTSFGEGHALSLNGYFANSESTGQSKASNLDAVLAHDFSLEYYYRVSNNLRFSDSSSRLGPLGQSIERRDVQAQNNVFWLPSDDYPLTLNSSISLSRSGAGSDASTGVTGLLSANYVFSPKLSATSAVSGGQSSAGVTRSRFVAFDTSASYSGDARTLGAFNHGWGAGAGIGATRSTGGSSRSMTVSVSQSLDRGFTLDERSSVNLAFSESASIGRATTSTQGASVDSDSSNLSHLANLNYFRSEEGASFSAGITAQDSRTFAKSDGSYAQSIGASGNGQFFIDRLSSMSASIGWGFSRTHSNPSWTQYGSGSASYLRSRPFGLRAAAYSARLQLNIRRDARQPGQVVDNRGLEEPYLYNYSVEHGLDARVGLLSSRLSNSFAWDEGGQLTWGVNFRVTRQF